MAAPMTARKRNKTDASTQTEEPPQSIFILNPQAVNVYPPGVPPFPMLSCQFNPETGYYEGAEEPEPEPDEEDEDYDYDTTTTDSDYEPPPASRGRKRKAGEYDQDEAAYFQKLGNKKQAVIRRTEKEVAAFQHVKVPLRFKILEAPIDLRLKSHAIHKLNSISRMDPSSSEYHKMMNYVEAMSRIPLGKYRNLPVTKKSSPAEITAFIDKIRTRLDTAVFGHEDAKEQIIRLLAQWISNPQSKGLVIGIEGVMGCGKTTLVKEGVCKALDLPFGFVPLGGISDGSFLVGHSYTYEGSRWGRIVEILSACDCMNPILFFDELDKVSTTRHGEEIINILIHLTDASQSDSFHDKYFSDIPLDLSRCLVIFSYNDGERINPILRDRMVTVHTSGYTAANKVAIARDYMLPEILAKFGFPPLSIVFPDSALQYIITRTPEEQGVRNFRRSLEEIVSKLNLARLLDPAASSDPKTMDKTEDIDKLLSLRKNKHEKLPMMYI